ncbi:hypothetical protein [Bacillus xiapuensis]|uniref:Uncharacterized protein n=1 Tax=Bacillus xiapuensis TaxID=2014075 RepID=A0ABU6N8G2_9BACI|nr:hypothetical protein [Bacillus xiapuensis]
MNWFDKYVMENETGYLISEFGGLFIDAGDDYVRHVKGDVNPINLKEISKGEFLNHLIS